jgi:hypothetical protein
MENAEEWSVECYAGPAYATEPRALRRGGQSWPVERVLARWRTPAGPAFRVRCAAGEFVLSYDEAGDFWKVEGGKTQALRGAA